ncbi:DUF899 domain-containing protein [Phyllobacterium sp. K27]
MQHEIVSREQWLQARTALLEKEKAFMKAQDRMSAEKRALPWVKIEKEYVFDSPSGKVTLSDLFKGRSQLFVKHFMLAPGQEKPCHGCSLVVDHMDGILRHLANNDVSYVSIARAPIAEIEAARRAMGWNFPWVSSFNSDFNYDFDVSFTAEEREKGTAFYNYQHGDPGIDDLSGGSVFYKDEAGQIYHTYSAFGRGDEQFLGVYAFFDVMPKGRNENGPHFNLGDWARLKDTSGRNGNAAAQSREQTTDCACSAPS